MGLADVELDVLQKLVLHDCAPTSRPRPASPAATSRLERRASRSRRGCGRGCP